MKESTLARFLAGDVTVTALGDDLMDAVGTNTLRAGQNLVADFSMDVEVTRLHLVRLCEGFLAGELNAEQLEAIAFFLVGSDHFIWDTDIEDGALVADVLFDWSTPEINYPMTPDNIEAYRAGLLEGGYPFARHNTAR